MGDKGFLRVWRNANDYLGAHAGNIAYYEKTEAYSELGRGNVLKIVNEIKDAIRKGYDITIVDDMGMQGRLEREYPLHQEDRKAIRRLAGV